MKKIISIAMAAILALGAAFAIGVSPSKISIDASPGEESLFSFRVINNDALEMDVEIYASGQAAEFLMFDSEKFTMGSQQANAEVTGSLILPENFTAECGASSAEIVVMAQKAGEEAMINVVGAVIARLMISLPANSSIITESCSTNIPTPKGGEEPSREENLLVEEGLLSSSSPFLYLLAVLGMALFLFLMVTIRRRSRVFMR